jgi:hypothetical protein
VTLNCDEIFGSFSPDSCSSLAPLPSSCPASTCVSNSTRAGEETVTCCPIPYTVHSITGECVISCPFEVFNSAKQDRTLMISYFIVSWISILCSMIAILPQLLDPFYRSLPQSIPMILLINYSGHLITANWGMYLNGWEGVCEYDDDFEVTNEHYLNSGVCVSIATFQVFFVYSYMIWSFWFSVRIVFHIAQ